MPDEGTALFGTAKIPAGNKLFFQRKKSRMYIKTGVFLLVIPVFFCYLNRIKRFYGI